MMKNQTPEAYKNISILFVDDDKIAQKLLSNFLKNWDFDIASSGEQALDKMEKKNYSIVILDYQMPGMDGIELTKKIHERHSLIQIIMVTGSNDISILLHSLEAGASDFITKPLNKKNLIDIILTASEKSIRWKETIKSFMKR